jgi:hypothetical protein
MKPTKTELASATEAFTSDLNELLRSIRDRAVAQFGYNLDSNVPAGIMQVSEAPAQAIRSGIVSACSKLNGYGIEPSIHLAASILEDVNAHREAAPLFESIKEWRKENGQ